MDQNAAPQPQQSSIPAQDIQQPAVIPKHRTHKWLFIVLGIGVVVLVSVFALLFTTNNDSQTKDTSAPQTTKTQSKYENECYSFDKTGLKEETFRSKAKYTCEVTVAQDNEGYFPVVDILVYEKMTGGFAGSVDANKKAFEAEGLTVTKEDRKVAGKDAVILYAADPSIESAPTVKYIVLIDATDAMTSAVGKKLVGVGLLGNSLSYGNEALLEQVLTSWNWK
jgi:hypothetical protein